MPGPRNQGLEMTWAVKRGVARCTDDGQWVLRPTGSLPQAWQQTRVAGAPFVAENVDARAPARIRAAVDVQIGPAAVVGDGSAYGADHTIYIGNPLAVHSTFLVFQVAPRLHLAATDAIAFNRLAASVKKRALIGVEPRPESAGVGGIILFELLRLRPDSLLPASMPTAES